MFFFFVPLFSAFSARVKEGVGRRWTDGYGWISGIPYSFVVDFLFCGSSWISITCSLIVTLRWGTSPEHNSRATLLSVRVYYVSLPQDI